MEGVCMEKKELTDDTSEGQEPNIAQARRRDKGGQLTHNPEQPAEEGAPVSTPNPPADSEP
jgi:hypothetical protein